MTEWQPIDKDTAPGVYMVCSIKDVAEGEYTVETMQINDLTDPEHRFFNLNSHNYSRSDWWTHWMPLPDPPVAPLNLGPSVSTNKRTPV